MKGEGLTYIRPGASTFNVRKQSQTFANMANVFRKVAELSKE